MKKEQRALEEQEQFRYKHPRLYRLGRFFSVILVICFVIGSLSNLYLLVNNILRQNGYSSIQGLTTVVVTLDEEADAAALKGYAREGDLLLVSDGAFMDFKEDRPIAFRYRDKLLIGTLREVRNGRGDLLMLTAQSVGTEEVLADPAQSVRLLGSVEHRLILLGSFTMIVSSLLGRLLLVALPFTVYLISLLVRAWIAAEIYRRTRRQNVLDPETGEPIPLPKLAVWPHFSTLLFVLFAINLGTYDSRQTDKQLACRAAAARDPVAPLDRFTPPVTHPVRMRRNRPVRTQKLRRTRPLRPISNQSR